MLVRKVIVDWARYLRARPNRVGHVWADYFNVSQVRAYL